VLVDGLLIPGRILTLLEAGIWPRTPDEAGKQNLQSLVPKEIIRRFHPKANGIYFYPPPFHSLASLASGPVDRFWSEFGALEEISPEASIEIADFGVGFDSPILLDYRNGPTDPCVIRLCWSREKGVSNTNWVQCADSFDSFADMLGLPAKPN
jgi:hypothetical protein